ncbi:MAG: hypothetical protein K9N35_07660 [Candidatus Marinimicrobia bacterium]|nr:hypothetical protein [Candidatus Neomarinimicrobiota bacterium]
MYIIRSIAGLLLISFMAGSPVYGDDQASQGFEDQTKTIRIKKIASEWKGAILTLHTRDEEEIHGRLVEVMGGQYHMEIGDNVVQIPLEDVIMVSFDPGMPEAFLSLASTFMGSAFLSGAMMLVQDDASTAQLGISALLGLIGGGLWGYSTFYESEVIYLE